MYPLKIQNIFYLLLLFQFSHFHFYHQIVGIVLFNLSSCLYEIQQFNFYPAVTTGANYYFQRTKFQAQPTIKSYNQLQYIF